MSDELEVFHREFTKGKLGRKDLPEDPLTLVKQWIADAAKEGNPEPNAMSVSTVDESGTPQSRMVLLKALNDRGFVFCTSFDSPKGKQLAANNQIALLFYWPESERQIRITGVAEPVSRDESAGYFYARPRGSQLAVLAGLQSSVLLDRKTLEDHFHALAERFEGLEVELPASWGGFRVQPRTIEFWQGGENRLHDRFLFTREGESWRIERLSP
jgi:pyridoxamine 5'-phosphate oxidase